MPWPITRTRVFDSYWCFAAERLLIYYRRLSDPEGPWTDDAVLSAFRFTNSYRAADRVSQYLIREVQYGQDRSQAPAEVFFRTILFKIFNRIDTWDALERELGPMSWQSSDLRQIAKVLDRLIAGGRSIYSAAYIMPSPALGETRKHGNHLVVLHGMMTDSLPAKLASARSLEQAYRLILDYPGLGPFLAFQYAIDLNYSSLLDFDEDEFVVAGPGALDGLVKCFGLEALDRPELLIREMTVRQSDEFARLGLTFEGLFGRPLKLVDCQNLFCEISKYARIAHPDVPGVSGRTRIKQRFKQHVETAPAAPFFPPKWNLKVPDLAPLEASQALLPLGSR